MSDRFYAEINIGGKVSSELVEDLCSLITGYECDPNFPAIAPKTKLDLLDLAEANDGIITIRDYEAVNGEFEDLENWCEENNVSYTRYSAGYSEYMPERKDFRAPNFINIEITTDEGDTAIRLADVLKIIEEYPNDILQKIREKHPEIPELEKFEVV